MTARSNWPGAAAVISALATAGVLVGGPGFATTPTALFLVVAFGALAIALRGADRCHPRLILGLGAILLTLAVVRPPTQSHDLWSYALYGRIAAVHHADPYQATPADFPDDPLTARIAPTWRDAPSVYGPLFTAWSAGIARVAGSSTLALRLGFQLTAALAVSAAAWLVVRARAGSTRGLALLVLNPVVVISVVNDAHADALVLLAALMVVVLLAARRPALAGVVGGLGMLVKLTMGVPLLGIVLWFVFRRVGWRTPLRLLVAVGAVVVAGYLISGRATALHATLDASGRVSRGATWSPVVRALSDTSGTVPGTSDPDAVARWISRIGAVAVLGLTAALVSSAARDEDDDLDVAVAAGPLAYGVSAAYVYPWYSSVAFPFLTRRRDALLATVALVHVASLQITSIAGRRFTWFAATGGPAEPSWHVWYRSYGNALVQLALIGVLVAWCLRRRRDPRRALSTTNAVPTA